MYIIEKIIFKKIIITLAEKFEKKIIKNAEDRTIWKRVKGEADVQWTETSLDPRINWIQNRFIDSISSRSCKIELRKITRQPINEFPRINDVKRVKEKERERERIQFVRGQPCTISSSASLLRDGVDTSGRGWSATFPRKGKPMIELSRGEWDTAKDRKRRERKSGIRIRRIKWRSTFLRERPRVYYPTQDKFTFTKRLANATDVWQTNYKTSRNFFAAELITRKLISRSSPRSEIISDTHKDSLLIVQIFSILYSIFQ